MDRIDRALHSFSGTAYVKGSHDCEAFAKECLGLPQGASLWQAVGRFRPAQYACRGDVLLDASGTHCGVSLGTGYAADYDRDGVHVRSYIAAFGGGRCATPRDGG